MTSFSFYYKRLGQKFSRLRRLKSFVLELMTFLKFDEKIQALMNKITI